MNRAVPTGPPLPQNFTAAPPPLPPVNDTGNITGPPPPALLPPKGGSPGLNKSTLVALGTGAGIGGALVLVFVGILAIWCKSKKRNLQPNGFASASLSPPKGDPVDHKKQRLQLDVPPSGDNVAGFLPKFPSPDILSYSQQFSGASSSPPPPSVTNSMSSDRTHRQAPPPSGLGLSKTTFTYEELEYATAYFSSNNLLGQGGFGYVYKGVLDGKEVAIKQLKIGSGQGEREFQAEVETISRIQHKHLVSLVGYCTSGDHRLLVYEFVPNKTLEFHLHGDNCPLVTWANRVKIALGVAKGLAYLHEDCQPRIIHRDVKASNILLDNDFEAKVADFGLARLNYEADTHVSTRVMGTFGYLAPEYALTGKLTEKSDVFSFGVMLLELITGRRPIDKAQHYLDDNIVDWARPLLTEALKDGNYDNLADSRLQRNYDLSEMTRMVACAAVCVRHLARHRPPISQVVQVLEGNIPVEDLNNRGVKPGHNTVLGFQSSDYNTSQYKEDLKKFRKMAFGSQEQQTTQSSCDTNDSLHQTFNSSS